MGYCWKYNSRHYSVKFGGKYICSWFGQLYNYSLLQKRRPPSFFANLRKTLNLMLGSFKNPDDYGNCDSLKRTQHILKVNGMETTELIHYVCKIRFFYKVHENYKSSNLFQNISFLVILVHLYLSQYCYSAKNIFTCLKLKVSTLRTILYKFFKLLYYSMKTPSSCQITIFLY